MLILWDVRRFGNLLLTSLSAVMLVTAGAPSANAQDDAEPGRAETKVAKNCLLILLDAFDGARVSHLGYPRETTPHLDAFAARGVSFSNAYSQCSNTLGSTTSFMTSRYLPAAREAGAAYSMREEDTPLAELFAQSGFAAAAYSENPFIRPNTGFDRGFHVFQWYPVILRKRDGEPFRKRDESVTQQLLRDASTWITANNGKNGWLCYLHILRPHGPYFSPDPFGSKFRPPGTPAPSPSDDLRIMQKHAYRGYTPTAEEVQLLVDVYDGSLSYVDRLMFEFLEGLRTAGALDDTLIVFFSDHGEAFLQHGVLGHNTNVYREMVQVPFVFVPPAGTNWEWGTRDEVVELVDLYPTLAEAFGLEYNNGLDGTSLLPVLQGASVDSPETVYTQSRTGDLIAVRHGATKMIFTTGGAEVELIEWYDVELDRAEQQNLLPTTPPPAPALEFARAAIARNYIEPELDTAQFDPEQEDQLRALGYVE